MLESQLDKAAEAIIEAEALLIGAGAGMSVDSGIPAYRLNPEGSLPEDPQAAARQLTPMNPGLFRFSPREAWAIVGRRLQHFRHTIPHEGYGLLRSWGAHKPGGLFVLTSNVDGQFATAGFEAEQLFEGHGCMHFLQCVEPCHDGVWSAEGFEPSSESPVALESLPRCPRCGALARPNVFFFGDSRFVKRRGEEQNARYKRWIASLEDRKLAVIECGAGTAVPTIRNKCEAHAQSPQATLIRINLMEPHTPHGVSLPLGAKEALLQLEQRISRGLPG